MISRDLLARFLPFTSTDRTTEPVSLHIEPEGDGLTVFIRPDALTDEERKAVWLDLAAAMVEVIEANLPGVRARVVIPDNRFDGVLQYTWPARTQTGMEGRLVWADICSLSPLMSQFAVEAINRRRALATRTARPATPPRRSVRR